MNENNLEICSLIVLIKSSPSSSYSKAATVLCLHFRLFIVFLFSTSLFGKENACFNIFLMPQKAKYLFFLCTWQVSGERKRNKGLTCLHMHIHNLFPLPGKGNEQSAEKPSWCWGGMSAGEAAGRPPTGPGCPSTTSWHEAGWTACSPYETTAHWQMDLQKQKSFF